MRDGNLPADERSLGAFLVARARRTSDARLAADAGVGLIAAVACALLRPPFWVPLTALAVAFAAYGTWAILDRELDEVTGRRPAGQRRLFVAARAAAAALGIVAAVAAGLTLFFAALGDSWQL
ncbi:MAG TPA: hypothetical protein VLE53_00065 [Gemmatimonadaceae bacterium]|nr:hypothetical protein [Gemmatimonadaceae bacterium]